MSRAGRSEIDKEVRQELWSRSKNGESLMDIGAAINKHRSTVLRVLSRGGGIYQPPRQRSGQSLTLNLKEREEISRGIASGCSIRQIVHCIGRAPSTVNREIARNKDGYRYACRANNSIHNARKLAGNSLPATSSIVFRIRTLESIKMQNTIVRWKLNYGAGPVSAYPGAKNASRALVGSDLALI